MLYQAARYTQHCRLFAPVYRQLTLQGIGLGGGSADEHPGPPPYVYGDVRDAWRDYLKNYNDGAAGRPHRPLAGHVRAAPARAPRRSTPSRRCASCWSPPAAGRQRARAPGPRRGRRLPARARLPLAEPVRAASSPTRPSTARCRRDSLFGRSTNPGDEVLCTDPAALGGGDAPLTSIFPTRARSRRGRRSALATNLVGVPRPAVSTDLTSARPDSYDSSVRGRRRCRRPADQPAGRRARAHRGARRAPGACI